MKDYWLLWLAVVIGYLGAAVAILSLFLHDVRSTIVHPLTLAEGITAGLVFVRSALDPGFRRGFSTFARRIMEFRRITPWRKQFFDPDWGCFAPRYGSLSLRFLQLAALFEALVSVFVAHAGMDDIVFLAVATFFVATGIGTLYVGLTTELEELA